MRSAGFGPLFLSLSVRRLPHLHLRRNVPPSLPVRLLPPLSHPLRLLSVPLRLAVTCSSTNLLSLSVSRVSVGTCRGVRGTSER
jgi:hypothetical protein